MESLKELYKIGKGPSSSHTMGPVYAAGIFMNRFSQSDYIEVELYGSLAKTGKGHLTDQAIEDTLKPIKTKINFNLEPILLKHPNTLEFKAFKNGKEIGYMKAYSVGGGKIEIEGDESINPPDVYLLSTFKTIKEYCKKEKIRIYQYVERSEGESIWEYLDKIWSVMKDSIHRGLEADGVLPGGLNVQRRAKLLYQQKHIDETPETRENRIVCSYAFAACEENASGGTIVTAPTCGSCGIVPSVLMYMQEKKGFSDKEILRALATAGIIGDLIKTNASISGAQCGCQAEVGSACCMGAAALAELFDMDIDQIEYAAEVAMEHHLGLTCDPIGGLVQIPCIERNAVAAMRAINALSLANFLTYSSKISFDVVIDTMYETGKDLFSKYKETGEGGLAVKYTDKK